MPRYDLLENFPLQIFTYDDLQAILDEVIQGFPQEWRTKTAEREWRKLARQVREALSDVFLRGPGVKKEWVSKIRDCLSRTEGQPAPAAEAPAAVDQPQKGKSKRPRKLRPDVCREIRIAYLNMLDQLYGAILRHVLRNIPTAVTSSTGHFHLSRLGMFRYARVHETEAMSALEQLMELLHEGPRFEVEYSWKPLGESLAESESRAAWRRR